MSFMLRFKNIRPLRIIGVSFGMLSGLGGFIHALGEIKQGNVKPESIFIPSWKEGPIALYYDGDPAITILPNMLYTGLVCLIISVFVFLWSLFFLRNKRAGLILLFSSFLLLLFGGGVGPPVLGALAGIAGAGIGGRFHWFKKIAPLAVSKALGAIWPFVFSMCLFNGIFLVVGHVAAAYYFAPADGSLFSNSFLLALPLLLISILSGIYYEINSGSE